LFLYFFHFSFFSSLVHPIDARIIYVRMF
jgi:hypothetical protein